MPVLFQPAPGRKTRAFPAIAAPSAGAARSNHVARFDLFHNPVFVDGLHGLLR